MEADPHTDTIEAATAPPQRRRRSRAGLLILLVVSLLILGLGGLGAYLAPRWHDDPVEPEETQTAAQVVQAFLEALARADAAAALGYSATKTDDTTFLTDEFLSTSQQANPLTDINVVEAASTDSPALIEASYFLGEQKVQARYTVQRYEQGWLLDHGFLPLDIADLMAKGVPLSLNGVDLGTATTINLFPGAYTFASLDPMLTVDSGTFVLEYPESTPIYSMGIALSQDAVKKIQAAAKSKLSWCLAQKVLEPDGCGFGFAGSRNGTINPDTIKWAYSGKAPKTASIEPSLDGPSLTRAVASFSVKVSFQALSDDRTRMYQETSGFKRLRADFSDPEKIIVTFGT